MVDIIRPNYVAPNAVPTAWATPIPQERGKPGNMRFHKLQVSGNLDGCIKLIVANTAGLSPDECLLGTFELSESDSRTAYFHGSINYDHAKHLVEKLLA